MKAPAWYLAGYEQHEGELDLQPDALVFNRKKGSRAGTFAAFGLLGLALSSAYEHFMTIPRTDIQGTFPSPNSPTEFALYTTRGMLVFNVQDRGPWLQALGVLPPPQ